LRRLAFLPSAVADALLRYFKAQGGMDPTNDRVPQDGRMAIVFGNRDFDLRLSVLPASRGERLVIRLLDQSRVYSLGAVGFSPAELQTMRRMMTSSAGVILMTGPTGSGKTSTLYSMLADLHRPDVAIVTVENPVEYRIPGISQVEVNAKAGLTFGASLRSILRQDPDIILIGEIRDAETAEIAMQSAMTGHLVLSTLHTNDALTAIPRLLDLDVPPSVVADGIIGVIAQRLLPRLCTSCRLPVKKPLTPDEELFAELTGERPAFRAAGCAACDHTGYFGRFPVTEMIEMTPELAHAISTGKSGVADLAKFVGKQFKPMSFTAANRIISGDTTALEAARVLGRRFWNELAGANSKKLGQGAALVMAGADNAAARTGVLLFSRDADATPALVAALEAVNLRVVTSGDPVEARALLEQNEDIMLLVIDSETREKEDKFRHLISLRQSLTWAGLPVVVLVGEDDMEIRKVLEDFGINDYLVKPVAPDVLVSRVRAAFQR
jgi:type IV pilus assembly protein PilB